jgi:hypothetical protein
MVILCIAPIGVDAGRIGRQGASVAGSKDFGGLFRWHGLGSQARDISVA